MSTKQLSTLGAVIKTAYEGQEDTNAFTNADKTKLTGIQAGAEVNAVDSVAGRTGDVVLGISDIEALQTNLNAKATPADIAAAINNVLNGAPAALDTLKELADALGDDANFAATLAAQISAKANAIHSHVIGDVTGLQTALDGKSTPSDIAVAIANLVGSSPAALDTLNELASALNDDPNFAATISAQISAKANAVHGHIISDVTGLQTALDAKSTPADVAAAIADSIADLVGSSPAALDTLNELAAALGDDPNFATTILAKIASMSSGQPFAPAGKYSPLVFTPNDGYANRQPSISRTVPLHDASSGAAPSFTTAKKRGIAVVSVAGTINGIAVSRGDLLMANRNSPTLVSHWDVVKDCSAEFVAAVEAAQGAPLELNGTYLINDANPDAPVNLIGDFYIFNNLDRSFLFQLANDTYATANTIQVKCSALGLGSYTEQTTLVALQRGSRFTLQTSADAANFSPGQMMTAYCDAVAPETAASSSKGYLRESFRIQAIDTASGYIYADKVLKWHTEIAGATNIYINSINSDRSVRIVGGTIGGAPSFVGKSLGWNKTLRGDQETGTITANSGASRTINSPGHMLVAGLKVHVGSVSGTTHTTCPVTSVIDADNFTITIPTKQDWNNSAPGIGTSGSIYYRPAFVINNFVHLGGSLIVEHANNSYINVKTNRLWAAGVRIRHSSYCRTWVEGFNNNDPYTQNNNTTGRLVYQGEDYGGSENWFDIKGQCGRHAFTSNSATTTQAFDATHWYDRSGNAVNTEVNIDEEGADGGGADTHPGANGVVIHSKSRRPNRQNYEGSYQGFGGNVRGSNETRYHRQTGGYEGVVLRAFENQAGSVHQLNLDINDIPYANSNTMAFRSEDYTAIGNKPRVSGKWKFKNVGRGFKIDDGGIDVRLSDFEHLDIALAAGYIVGTSKFHADVMHLGYVNNTSGQATRSGILMDGASEISAPIINLNLGATANPAAIFVDNDNIAGKKVTYGLLNITDPYGVGMPAIVTPGRGANFTVQGGIVIYNGAVQNISVQNMSPITTKGDLLVRSATALQRLPVGLPGKLLVPNSNDANGVNWYASPRLNLKPGRILTSPIGNSLAANALNAGIQYFAYVYVHKRTTFSALMFATVAVTAASYNIGVYADAANNADVPSIPTGLPIAAVTVGPVTTTVATSQSGAVAVTLDPGGYWMSIQPSVNGTINCSTSTAYGPLIGAGDMTTAGARISYTNAFSNGLADLTSVTLVYTEGSTNPYLGLVVA